MIRFGIDLGGTKIEIIALDARGRTLLRRRRATPQGDYQGTLRVLADLVGEAEAELGATGSVGIGTPGSFSKVTGLLKNSNSVCLNDQPVQADLEALLGRPVRIRNDADCFALSEASDGAAVGAATVFGVILGTGTGAGIVVNGSLLNGPNGIAGEWGHNPLPWPEAGEWPGRPCYCGRSGCIETFLSGPGLSAELAAPGGRVRDAHEIAAAADAGEPDCIQVMSRYQQRLARALAHVINILDPDVIVLGGGLSRVESLYREVPLLWTDFVFSDRVDTRLVAPLHGDSSGVRGAAWLWPVRPS